MRPGRGGACSGRGGGVGCPGGLLGAGSGSAAAPLMVFFPTIGFSLRISEGDASAEPLRSAYRLFWPRRRCCFGTVRVSASLTGRTALLHIPVQDLVDLTVLLLPGIAEV